MRFVFLQFGMTAYQDACLRALHDQGNEILNVFPEAYENAAFDAHSFREYGEAWIWKTEPDADELIKRVEEFAPDAIIMVSWQRPVYRKVMAHMRGRALRILLSSNIWESRAKQWLGRATHRVYLRPLYDAVFVPGDRSEWFARRLGFRADQVIRGTNSADVDVFDQGPRSPEELGTARRFLFTGRLMPYKGVTVLRDAYQLYRAETADPWDLDIVGAGEMAAQLADLPGVRMHGFLQPPELAKLMHETTCLVLPSFMDFFGVVVHEAALSGQVLLCTDSVGATPYLLQDGFNGWTVATGNVRSLADGMARVHALPLERLMAMSAGSQKLASRFSPTLWAQNLTEQVAMRWPARAAVPGAGHG
jgi:glycosyltransferase involved in cell wall biosynthesis